MTKWWNFVIGFRCIHEDNGFQYRKNLNPNLIQIPITNIIELEAKNIRVYYRFRCFIISFFCFIYSARKQATLVQCTRCAVHQIANQNTSLIKLFQTLFYVHHFIIGKIKSLTSELYALIKSKCNSKIGYILKIITKYTTF